MSRAPEALPGGEVVSLRPALLTVKQAALYLACSPSLLDHLRAGDTKRRQRGEEPLGPAWLRVPHGIRYALADLDLYLQRTAEPFGVMDAKRRGATAPEPV